jgi:methyl coenzyme M reductase subunit C
LYRMLGGSQIPHDKAEEISSSLGFDPQTVQHISIHVKFVNQYDNKIILLSTGTCTEW